MTPQFTPTQQRIMDVLADGLAHRREELRSCLPDELGTAKNIKPHLSAIRKVIRPGGRDVLCVWDRRSWSYQLVHTVGSGE